GPDGVEQVDHRVRPVDARQTAGAVRHDPAAVYPQAFGRSDSTSRRNAHLDQTWRRALEAVQVRRGAMTQRGVGTRIEQSGPGSGTPTERTGVQHVDPVVRTLPQ